MIRVKWSADELKVCRRLIANSGDGSPIAVYARMALALAKGKGVRLSADDISGVFDFDEAVSQALSAAIQTVIDDDSDPTPKETPR